jgi:K+-sensing histidine kinase KdpD
MQIRQAINLVSQPQDPTLHNIVNEIIQEAAPLAVHNKNFIVNNVPADLMIEANGAIISSVFNKLFDTALRHTKNSVILISAKTYGMTVLVQVKSKGNISPALPEDICHACLKAKKTGGIIEMIQCENDSASIAYCFLNVAAA